MLDVRERLFARYVAEGRTHRQSVEMAGFTCNPDKKGSELVKKPEIASLIQEKSLELEQNRAVSLQDHLDSLAMLRDDARDAGQYSAAIQAEHHMGQGFTPIRRAIACRGAEDRLSYGDIGSFKRFALA